jgi:DNA-directed RNA polymerase II subunit RPB1
VDREFIAAFIKSNPLLHVPKDLLKWCIRFTINKTTLILKSMSLEQIIAKLRDTFPSAFIIYTPENTKTVIIRVYMKSEMFRGSVVSLDAIINMKETFMNTIIRGIKGIKSTKTQKIFRSKIVNEGPTTGEVVKDDNKWGIILNGLNISSVLLCPYIEKETVRIGAIQGVAATFGIEAARRLIIMEMHGIIDNCDYRHLLIYADEMTFSGVVTSVESTGMKNRDASNVLLRMGFSKPTKVLEEAAIAGMYDKIAGITAPLLLGSVPHIGTLYNSFIVNPEVIKKYSHGADDFIAGLMGETTQ